MKRIILIAICLAPFASAQDHVLWAELKPTATDLKGTIIHLEDVAKVQGTCTDLVAEARRLVIGRQASGGTARLITRQTIQSLWKAAAGKRYACRVIGAESVRTTGRTLALKKDEIELLVHRHLARKLAGQSGDPRILSVRAEGELVSLRGQFGSDYEVRFDDPEATPAGLVKLHVVARSDGKDCAKVAVVAEVQREGWVLVAARAINPGRTIQPGDVRAERRTIDANLAGHITRPDFALGMRSSVRIPKGGIVLEQMLKTPPVVFNRDPVIVEAVVGNLTVEGQGRAQMDGSIGETIRVRMDRNRKTIMAEVIDSRRVRLVKK